MEFNYVDLRLFITPEDNEKYSALKKAFFALFGLDGSAIASRNNEESLASLKKVNDKNLVFTESTSEGFENRKIKVLQARLKGKKNARSVFSSIIKNIDDEQKKRLLLTTNSRVDDNLNYYIRLDIGSLLEGAYEITDSGSCYHFTFSLITYPKDRKKAIEGITALLSAEPKTESY